MRPAAGRTNPLMVRSSVVLPAPLAPRTAVIVRSSTCSDTPSSARTAPYVVTTSSTESIADLPRRHLGGVGVDVLAEIGLEHRGVVSNLGGRAGRDDAAEVEDDDPVAHLHHEVHVVLHEQDRHP